jgi:hypothetical protein
VDGLNNSLAASNYHDDYSASDAGTVVENDLEVYNEPD